MKSSLPALALLTAAAQASAQETTQGQMCANIAVMPPPAGDAPNRMLSDDAEVAAASLPVNLPGMRHIQFALKYNF